MQMAFDKNQYRKAMKVAGVTQKQLAEVLNKDLRTISRWLDPKLPIKSDFVGDLCLAIGALPTEFDPDWVGSIETESVTRVSAKISSASKNNYWLLKKIYNISEKEVVELAPTLFGMFIAAVLEQTNEGENDPRKLAVEILAEEYGYISETEMFGSDPIELEEDQLSKEFIKEGKIFGGFGGSDHTTELSVNPFAKEMEKFVKNSKRVKLGVLPGGTCPTSRGSTISAHLINEISGNDPEISEAISLGAIKLFSKEFTAVANDHEKRIEWMKNCVIKEQKARAERLKNLYAKHPKLNHILKDVELEGKTRLMARWEIEPT